MTCASYFEKSVGSDFDTKQYLEAGCRAILVVLGREMLLISARQLVDGGEEGSCSSLFQRQISVIRLVRAVEPGEAEWCYRAGVWLW